MLRRHPRAISNCAHSGGPSCHESPRSSCGSRRTPPQPLTSLRDISVCLQLTWYSVRVGGRLRGRFATMLSSRTTPHRPPWSTPRPQHTCRTPRWPRRSERGDANAALGDRNAHREIRTKNKSASFRACGVAAPARAECRPLMQCRLLDVASCALGSRTALSARVMLQRSVGAMRAPHAAAHVAGRAWVLGAGGCAGGGRRAHRKWLTRHPARTERTETRSDLERRMQCDSRAAERDECGRRWSRGAPPARRAGGSGREAVRRGQPRKA